MEQTLDRSGVLEATAALLGSGVIIYGLTRPWLETDYAWNVYHTYVNTGMDEMASIGPVLAAAPLLFLLIGRLRGESVALRFGGNAAYVVAALAAFYIVTVMRKESTDSTSHVASGAYLTLAAAIGTGIAGRLAAQRVRGPNAASDRTTGGFIKVVFALFLAYGLLASCAQGQTFDGGGGWCDDHYVGC